MLLGATVSGVLGFFTVAVTLRLRGIFVGLATWFLAEVLRLTISNTPGYTCGVLGLAVKPLPDVWGLDFSRAELLPYYYLFLILVIIIFCSGHSDGEFQNRPLVQGHPGRPVGHGDRGSVPPNISSSSLPRPIFSPV